MTLNCGLIGAGMVSGMHAAAIAATGGKVRLAGVLARRPERARALADQFENVAVYPNLDTLVGDDSLDFVILATPPNARDVLCERLIARGLPVLTEKPVERDLARARAIVAGFAKANLPFGVLLQHRMRPAAAELIHRVRTGDLGTLATVDVRVPWWRDQSYYDAPGRGTYEQDGGGVLITQAIHTLDLMLQCTGPVEAVQAMVTSSALHQLEAEDFASASLRFASGSVGSVVASVTHFPGGSEEIVLNGTRASARLNAAQLEWHPHDGPPEVIGEAAATGGGADPMAFGHAWHQSVIEDFADAVANDRQPAITGASALAAHALIDAIQTSARTGMQSRVEAVS